MRTLYEEFRLYYLPWIVAGAVVAIFLWQQHTTMELTERINASYLDRLANVSESLERINTTLRTEGYTLPPSRNGSRDPRAGLPLGGTPVEGGSRNCGGWLAAGGRGRGCPRSGPAWRL